MLSCFYFWKCKTDLLSVTYTNLIHILTYVEIAIPTWCYSSIYPIATLAKFVS